MKRSPNNSNINSKAAKNGTSNGFLPHSLRFISSCIKTVSSNVRSAGVSVAGSISGESSANDHHKDQVLWACFDRLETGPSVKQVLLIGYSNGFQVLDVEDASNVCEVVSRRDDPVTFLQMQPIPAECNGCEGFRKSHPMLLVVASDDSVGSGSAQNGKDGLLRKSITEPHTGSLVNSPTTVRFYSLRSHNYVHILKFRSTVCMIRCSPKIVAVGLVAQIYCFDALTLENKFSVLTHPVPQLGGQGLTGVNIGYGPMAVGPRWLAYASNNPLLSNTGRLSPQRLSPSPGVSPSTSPNSGNLVARYAMESSKQLAAGLLNLGDMGYKTLSKYCHELLPDGSGSPISSNASWKVGRGGAHSTDMDAAGMVVVKDFMSRSIISQFRSHTSPISALCFDPSGTLLVTASVHGSNINIFRIMPKYLQNGSGTCSSYDWTASHVHLYKLHRGLTSAVIQDICFSHYSQWIAIVSSRGTCHVFVLSPFGGETGLQLVNSHSDGPTLVPVCSMPWWSTSSFLTNNEYSSPPPTITLSVVSRIKSGGWLSSVSNAASSAAGKIHVPSGVVAAVFHSSVRQNMHPALLNANVLEHLLVYSPSGHLIQYDLLPSFGEEHGEPSLRNGSGALVQMQEDELRVKVEPVQWWDVCRRADWTEVEEGINGIAIDRREAAEPVMGNSSRDDQDTGGKEYTKPLDRSHLYISNAEVQLRSARMPVWQKSKINFYLMDLHDEDKKAIEHIRDGELEIEKISVSEIEVRRKDLLPIFDPFHRIPPAWGDEREHIDGRFTASSVVSDGSKGKSQVDVASEAKSTPVELAEKSLLGSLRTPASLHDYDDKGMLIPSDVDLTVDEKDHIRSSAMLVSPRPNQLSFARISAAASPESPVNMLSYVEESYVVNSSSSPKISCLIAGPGTTQIHKSQIVTDEDPNTTTNHSDSSIKFIEKRQVHDAMHQSIGFGQYLQDGYCKASNSDESPELAESVKSEDEESDEILGGIFPFSEEG